MVTMVRCAAVVAVDRYNLADLVKFSCTLYCLHEYLVDITAVSQSTRTSARLGLQKNT